VENERRIDVEKSLSKFVTCEEASKKNYITKDMIEMLVREERIPYFSNRGEWLVNPEDITAYFEETICGSLYKPVAERKKKKKEPEPEPEPPAETTEG
jgi:hypothetical protein